MDMKTFPNRLVGKFSSGTSAEVGRPQSSREKPFSLASFAI